MRGTIESEAGVEAMRIEVIALLERHATYYRVRCKTVQEGVCQDLLQAVMAIGRGEGQGDALTARAVTAPAYDCHDMPDSGPAICQCAACTLTLSRR